MSLSTAPHIQSNIKTGSCPHGLPAGACPVCRGTAGGNSTTKRDIPRNPGEMTYNECLAMGALLKAQKNARESAKKSQLNHIQSLIQFQKTLDNTRRNILELSSVLTKSLPVIISKPVNFILEQIAAKTINLIKNTAAFITNIIQKSGDITDKLTALYGEMKASIQKNISKFKDRIKKKLKTIFFIFGADNEEKKIEEIKKAFNLKSFIHKLTQNLKNKKEDNKHDAGN